MVSKSNEEERKKLEASERAVTKDPTQPPQKKQCIKSIDGSISGQQNINQLSY